MRETFGLFTGHREMSGIYVRDLTTGEVRLIRGKQSYLVDPRKEIHITRSVNSHDWNLWIAASEPHKGSDRLVTTPWALSIIVPHNTAVLATSAAGQRVIEGPCVTLLEYEENLVPLRLSTNTPKEDSDPLVTCFLRTIGNRVSDVIEIESADFVRINLRITVSVTFQRDHRDKWFNAENYIQVLCDHLRSIVRSRTRTLSLSSLWPQLAAVVRDTILGVRNDADGSRKGRFFAENGMLVHEVEVLDATIEDEQIAEMMRSVQRESVTLTIGDRQAQDKLQSAKLRAELDVKTHELQAQVREHEAKLKELERKLLHETKLTELRDREAMAGEQSRLSAEREANDLRLRIEREIAAQTASREALLKDASTRAQAAQALHEEEFGHLSKLKGLDLALIDAQARAVVAERTAVQPQLVEALTALGDKSLLSEVAQNMNLVSLFRGKEAGEILKEVVGGTRFVPALTEALTSKPKSSEPKK